MRHGVGSGSSGGAVVDFMGRVVGIMLEPWSPISVVEIDNDMDEEEEEGDSSISSDKNSMSNSYRTYAISVVPCKIPKLLNALEIAE